MADENNSTDQNNTSNPNSSTDQTINTALLAEQEQQILEQARVTYEEAIAQGLSPDQALNIASDILNDSGLEDELVAIALNLLRLKNVFLLIFPYKAADDKSEPRFNISHFGVGNKYGIQRHDWLSSSKNCRGPQTRPT